MCSIQALPSVLRPHGMPVVRVQSNYDQRGLSLAADVMLLVFPSAERLLNIVLIGSCSLLSSQL